MNTKSEREYRLETFIKLVRAYYTKEETWTDFFEREYHNLIEHPEKQPEPPFNCIGEDLI